MVVLADVGCTRFSPLEVGKNSMRTAWNFADFGLKFFVEKIEIFLKPPNTFVDSYIQPYIFRALFLSLPYYIKLQKKLKLFCSKIVFEFLFVSHITLCLNWAVNFIRRIFKSLARLWLQNLIMKLTRSPV